MDAELLALVAGELNVKSIEPVPVPVDAGRGVVDSERRGRGCWVELDVAVTPELRLEGLARRAIRVIQQARRAGAFDLGQEIDVSWQSPDREVEAALTEFGQLISQRVRAAKYERAISGGPDAFEYAGGAFLTATFWLRPLLRVLRAAAASLTRHRSNADCPPNTTP